MLCARPPTRAHRLNNLIPFTSNIQRTCCKLCDVCENTALLPESRWSASGISDDLRPSYHPGRLFLLQRREEAWANVNFSKSVQVTVPFESTGIYDFTSGAFLLGTKLHVTSRSPSSYHWVLLHHPPFSLKYRDRGSEFEGAWALSGDTDFGRLLSRARA